MLPEAPPDPLPLMQRGFMPALLTLTTPADYLRWWEGYVATYLERDLRQMSQVESLVDFRRVMALLALRTGQLLNQSEVARDAGLSQPTIHRYLNLLEATHLFERVPPYLGSHTTRLLKSPRGFWSDVGLAVFLAGYFSADELAKAREMGAFFETLIYQHLPREHEPADPARPAPLLAHADRRRGGFRDRARPPGRRHRGQDDRRTGLSSRGGFGQILGRAPPGRGRKRWAAFCCMAGSKSGAWMKRSWPSPGRC